jgi:LuxR family transcriptional regulator, maltose regulon positive regulatory protein
MLSAPMGYGKTTLICDWLAQANISFAWLTFDAADNEVNRFLSYIAAAIGNALPKSAERLNRPLPLANRESIEAYLTVLINQIAESEENLTLILNDYEVIANDLCHAAVEFLIEYAPDNFHTLLLTRADPPLPLSRWRARGQLLELRADDLRFNRDEIRGFLVETMRYALTDNEIDVLDQRTQGWVASLRLLTLSLETAPKKQQFFKALDNNQSYIIDFLVDEALTQLPAETQAFLYRTSILSQFSGALCQAVTGNPHSESILRDLERHNLFLSRLDHDSRWYCFHPLFAECLHQRLREQTNICITDLHRNASDWHAANGNVDAALDHAFKAKDFDHAARVMESHAILWIDQGEYQAFTHWFDQLPRERLSGYPRLSAFYLCALLDSRNLDRFHTFSSLQAQLEKVLEVQTLIKAMHTTAAYIRGDYQVAQTLAERNIAEFQSAPPQTVDEFFAYSLNLSARIGICYQVDDLLETDQAVVSAVPVFLQAGLTGYALDALGVRASNKMRMGNLHQAEEILEQALLLLRRSGSETEGGAQSHPIAVRIYGPLSRLYYEQNRLTDSVAMAQKAIESSQSGGYNWGWRVVEVYATLGMAHLALIDEVSAFDVLDKIQQVENLLAGYPMLYTRTRLDAACQKMRLILALAYFDKSLYSRITEWESSNQVPGRERDETESAIWARYLISQGKIKEAEPILHRIQKEAEAAGRIGDLLDYLVLEASSDSLRHALKLAEPQDYCRTFVDGGERVQQFLAGVDSSYAKKVAHAFHFPHPGQTHREKSPWLNINERQILRLLCDEYSNQQIADELHLSVNTVKWYARRIYAALGVKNRREAMVKTKELGLM